LVRRRIFKSQIAVLMVAMLLPMMLPGNAEAFWWLFGRTQGEVQFSYLYINNTPFDESEESITLYKEFMPDGLVHIRGRALAGRSKIGSVMVSIDGKVTWQDAMLSDNGAFEFSFRPEIGQVYHIYVEAMETAGRTNDIDETGKIVTVLDSTIKSRVINVLDGLFNSYTGRDARGFMDLVSSDFTGERFLLEKAVLNDYRIFSNIDLRYSLTSVSTDAQGRAFAMITYERSVVLKADGKTYRDSGITGFSFTPEGGELKISMMRNPVIFGVSNAYEIASGVITSDENDQVFIIDESGDISLGTPDEGVQGPADYEHGTLTFRSTWFAWISTHQGYLFRTGTKVSSSNWFHDVDYDFYLETNIVFVHPSIGMIDLGVMSIDSVKSVPTEGYESDVWVEVGHCYALHLPDDTYAVIRWVAEATFYDDNGRVVDASSPDAAYSEASFEYKYRSDGLTRF
jgi:hypothetical protein